MTENEILKLRQEFSTINRRDPKAILKWFKDHQELTLADHCSIMQIREQTIMWFRNEYHINPVLLVETENGLLSGPICQPPIKPYKSTKLPANNDRKWIVEQYKAGASITGLADAADLNKHTIRKILRRAGLKLKPQSEIQISHNPCCNPEWLREHYIKNRLSLRQCAALAHTDHSVIKQWLIKFGFEIRSIFEVKPPDPNYSIDTLYNI